MLMFRVPLPTEKSLILARPTPTASNPGPNPRCDLLYPGRPTGGREGLGFRVGPNPVKCYNVRYAQMSTSVIDWAVLLNPFKEGL